jgi:hypothetical protein
MAEVGAIICIALLWHTIKFTSAARKNRRIKVAAKQRADASSLGFGGYENVSAQSGGSTNTAAT